MSTQKGNINRTRPQKHQNQFAFKNSMHDTSHITKKINGLQISHVCHRCKMIIDWKIKYKKYKPLKQPGKCNKCNQKSVKQAYHTMCTPCAKERSACPKCGENNKLVEAQPSKDEIQLDMELTKMLKTLSERKRRTFLRYMNGKKKNDKKKKHEADVCKQESEENNCESEKNSLEAAENEHSNPQDVRDDLYEKLKSLMNEDVSNDSDLCDDESDNEFFDCDSDN